jgi:predicted nucleic acid-binding protein
VKKPVFVMDSYALLAYFQAEPAGLKVKEILERARDNDAAVFLSLINLGETIYTVGRKLGWDTARETLGDLLMLPMQMGEVTMERVLSAARVKSGLPISYADAFVVGLAQELSATVVTGDPEFKRVESMVNVLWL